MSPNKMKILIFIGSLRCGGKERRLIELLAYLKAKAEMEFLVVVTKDDVQYDSFFRLDIPYYVLPKTWKRYDIGIFYQFYKICKKFKPDLIHSWGRIQTFYSLPAVFGQRIPLCNSQITIGLKPKEKIYLNLIDKINYYFSDLILTNSIAGMQSFAPPKNKTKVIYNGINLNRFEQLPPVEQVKLKYGLTTPYAVIMAASFSFNKDYDLFYRLAEIVTRKNNQVTFIGVGGYDKGDAIYKRMLRLSAGNPRIIFPGKVNDVESLVNACTIGVLFSSMEGISNSILEYMALGKPVIASNCGGNKELITHNRNGYLVTRQSDDELAELILGLINDPDKCEAFGMISTRRIHELFRQETMGENFDQAYKNLLAPKQTSKKQLALKIGVPNSI